VRIDLDIHLHDVDPTKFKSILSILQGLTTQQQLDLDAADAKVNASDTAVQTFDPLAKP
jgi:hypothetical protein